MDKIICWLNIYTVQFSKTCFAFNNFAPQRRLTYYIIFQPLCQLCFCFHFVVYLFVAASRGNLNILSCTRYYVNCFFKIYFSFVFLLSATKETFITIPPFMAYCQTKILFFLTSFLVGPIPYDTSKYT